MNTEVGATFPIVGVGIDWCDTELGTLPAILLWITGPEIDQDVYLQPHEARAVVKALQARLRVLEGNA